MNIGDNGNQDFDLNLAPIIDCFTVLITYLLVSASFLTLMVFEVGVSVSSESSSESAPKEIPISLIVSMKASKAIEFKISGGPSNIDVSIMVPGSQNNSWDFPSVNQKMKTILKQWPSLKELNLTAEAGVFYKDMAEAIDILEPMVTKVYLSQ
jgi:biopolymer transport protein ExbD